MDDGADGAGKDHDGAPKSQCPGEGITEAGHVKDDLGCGNTGKYHAFGHEDHGKDPKKPAFVGAEEPHTDQEQKVQNDHINELVKSTDRILRSGVFFGKDPRKGTEHITGLGYEEGKVYQNEYTDHKGKQYIRHEAETKGFL